jgi:hypothetical protein
LKIVRKRRGREEVGSFLQLQTGDSRGNKILDHEQALV